MAIFLRGNIYHYKFRYKGKSHRGTTEVCKESIGAIAAAKGVELRMKLAAKSAAPAGPANCQHTGSDALLLLLIALRDEYAGSERVMKAKEASHLFRKL